MSDETNETTAETAVETKVNNEVKKIRSRFKSWALWLALAALVVFCVKTFTGIDISEQTNAFLNLLLPILMAFGIVNDPTNKKGI